MNYYELTDINELLRNKSLTEQPLPMRTSLKIYKNAEKIANELIPVDKKRNDIIAKYAGGKQSISPEDEHYQECVKEIDELMMLDTTIDFEKIKISELEKVNLSVKEISALYPMLEEE
jgi:hypothetical protein